MMRKSITRTLVRSDIYAYCVKMVNNKPEVTELPVVTVWGKPSESEALKAVQSVHGKQLSVTIGNINQSVETYRISVDAFIENAEKIDADESEDETEE